MIQISYRTSFIFFSSEKRPQLIKEHPEWKFTEVGKELGRLWSTLSDDELAIFGRKAQEDKERYANVCTIIIQIK